MYALATEFPVSSSLDRATFIASVVAWLRGTKQDSLFNDKPSSDLDKLFAEIKSMSDGQILTVRAVAEGESDIGFRYDFPQDDLLWRTEGVLKLSRQDGKSPLLRIRSQCTATSALGKPLPPKKSYLIKVLLKDGHGGDDGLLRVTEKPHWLSSQDIDLAAAIVEGQATNHLPIVYVSATNSRPKGFQDQIEKMAYDLGGIAHVVVEPSRDFSFNLRDKTNGRNVYQGYIGIFEPHTGLQARFSPSDDLSYKVGKACHVIRTHMLQKGWDWTDLQDASLRAQRKREQNRLNVEDLQNVYEEELQAKDDVIRELQQQLLQRPTSIPDLENENNLLDQGLLASLGQEVYEGEFSDRVRHTIFFALKYADARGIDKRTRIVFERILNNTAVSQELQELRAELRRAEKDSKAPARISRLLEKHGYSPKSDKNHIRLEALPGCDGLAPVTLPKTPSDYRSMKNTISDIEKNMGINHLEKQGGLEDSDI